MMNAVRERNAAKSRVLRKLADITTLVRIYDGNDKIWDNINLREDVEDAIAGLTRDVHEMFVQADTVNKMVEEDDILRHELTKPIGRDFG